VKPATCEDCIFFDGNPNPFGDPALEHELPLPEGARVKGIGVCRRELTALGQWPLVRARIDWCSHQEVHDGDE